MTFPPLEPNPTAPDPGPIPGFPRPIDDEPGEDVPVPDPDNPTENPQPGPDLPPERAPFPDHLPSAFGAV